MSANTERPRPKPKYVVTCMADHTAFAAPDSDLEKRCIEREQQGFVDALILGPDECPECRQELERRNE